MKLSRGWQNATVTIYMWNLKYGTNEHIYKTDADSQAYRADLQLPKGKALARERWTESVELVDASYYI